MKTTKDTTKRRNRALVWAIAVVTAVCVCLPAFRAAAADPSTATDAETAACQHAAGTPTAENVVQATCAEEGSYDEVTRCTLCGEVLETRHVRVSCPPSHTPGDPVRENQKASTCTKPGSYEIVTYCEVCGKELQRERKQLEMLNHVADHQLKRTVRRGENGGTVVTFDDPAYPPLTKESELPEKYEGKTIKADRYLAGDGSKRTCADGETRCAVCGMQLEDAVPHTWDRDKMGKPGSMSKNGIITFSCLVCGETFQTYSTDHNYRYNYTTADARLALRYSVGLGSFDKVIQSGNFSQYDVDKNGAIEPADARLILRLAVGLPI